MDMRTNAPSGPGVGDQRDITDPHVLAVMERNKGKPVDQWEDPYAPPPGRHQMEIMDHTGHTVHTWDPKNKKEVEVARKAFKNALRKGMGAFRHGVTGRRGKIEEFDPKIERMVLGMQTDPG